MTNCKNYNRKTNDNYCPKCGQSVKLERIDRPYIFKQIQHLINIEKGFLYTAKELFIRPGKSIQEFIFENRNKHVKPVVFLIFTSIIFALTTYFLNIHYYYFNVSKITVLQGKVSLGAFGEWLNNNIGYTNLIIGCFIAFWIKVFFRTSKCNIYEVMVMLCFVLGEATLIQSLGLVIGKLTDDALIVGLGFLMFFLYPIWAIGQFFGKKKLINYLKSLIILILGGMSYLLVFILIGYIYKTLQN